MRRRRSWIGRVRLGLVSTLPWLLAACGTTTGTDAIDLRLSPSTGSAEARAARLVACNAFRPIDWSNRDTDETIRQAKGHNAAYAEICEETVRGDR